MSRKFANKLRQHALKMIFHGRSSHIGSVLSAADILAVLYSKILNINPKKPNWDDRDRFILSKGHAGAGVYAALALSGFFPERELSKHYSNGSVFSGHVSHKGIPGVEMSTGSLGHGLSVGVGMALSAKKMEKSFRVFVLLSDGELDEGSNWEAFMSAAHFHLNNLVAIIDYNKLQSLASIEETMTLEPLKEKFHAFGWSVFEVDGHDHSQLINTLETAVKSTDKPSVLIAHTIKGKGVSYMENQVHWHYAPPNQEELEKALAELGE